MFICTSSINQYDDKHIQTHENTHTQIYLHTRMPAHIHTHTKMHTKISTHEQTYFDYILFFDTSESGINKGKVK